jgi:hypothetical protein
LLLPFGAPARQFFNLMHISARDLYWIHFGKPMAYLKNTRRKTKLTEVEKSFAPMLDFIANHRFEMQALLGVRRCGGGFKLPEGTHNQTLAENGDVTWR